MSSKVDSGSYWRCRRDDCPARAKLDSSALLTCTNFNHNHPEEEFEGEDMEQDIKQVVSIGILSLFWGITHRGKHDDYRFIQGARNGPQHRHAHW